MLARPFAPHMPRNLLASAHLYPLDPSFNAQLLNQLPGLSYVVSGRHCLPSVLGPAGT